MTLKEINDKVYIVYPYYVSVSITDDVIALMKEHFGFLKLDTELPILANDRWTYWKYLHFKHESDVLFAKMIL